jgi:protein TonB
MRIILLLLCTCIVLASCVEEKTSTKETSNQKEQNADSLFKEHFIEKSELDLQLPASNEGLVWAKNVPENTLDIFIGNAKPGDIIERLHGNDICYSINGEKDVDFNRLSTYLTKEIHTVRIIADQNLPMKYIMDVQKILQLHKIPMVRYGVEKEGVVLGYLSGEVEPFSDMPYCGIRNQFRVSINAENQLLVEKDLVDQPSEIAPILKEHLLNPDHNDYGVKRQKVTEKMCQQNLIMYSKGDTTSPYIRREFELWSKKLEVVRLLGGSFMEFPSYARIIITTDKSTSYTRFIEVKNEIQSVFNELKDEFCLELFGQSYFSLNPKDEAHFIKAADLVFAIQMIDYVFRPEIQIPPPPPPLPPPPSMIEEIGILEDDVEEEYEVVMIEVPEPDVEGSPQEEEIFDVVEDMPEFPGGTTELYKYLAKNLIYPETANREGIDGKVYIQFIVRKTGKVTDLKLLRGIGGGCDEEALRLVKAMPDWTPGKQRGKPVDVRYTLPVRFYLK